jgi:hypothetical protein
MTATKSSLSREDKPRTVNPAMTVLQTAINQRRTHQHELVSRLGRLAGQAQASYQEADREAALNERLLAKVQAAQA